MSTTKNPMDVVRLHLRAHQTRPDRLATNNPRSFGGATRDGGIYPSTVAAEKQPKWDEESCDGFVVSCGYAIEVPRWRVDQLMKHQNACFRNLVAQGDIVLQEPGEALPFVASKGGAAMAEAAARTGILERELAEANEKLAAAERALAAQRGPLPAVES